MTDTIDRLELEREHLTLELEGLKEETHRMSVRGREIGARLGEITRHVQLLSPDPIEPEPTAA